MKQRLTFERPLLYPQQFAAIYAPQRIVVIEATTKCGKTIGCLAWLIEQAFSGRKGDQFWWIAPVQAQAHMAFERAKKAMPRKAYTANETRRTIRLLNGAVIAFKGGDAPDSLYGEDVRAAVIDEAARCKGEAWWAIRSTLTATRGPVRIIGNVKGRRNWAYKLARQAQAGAPDMHYAKLTALDAIDAGIFDVDELANAERTLPRAAFRELYFAEASDDEGNPFGMEAIRACVHPLSAAVPAVWGWDLAKSRDYTVGIALDEQGCVCRLVRFQKPWEETFADILDATGEVPALVDSTGVGDPILERLQRYATGQYTGFKFSAPAKQQLMEGLAVAIQRHEVRFPDGPIVNELEAFEYRYTRTGVQYTAPDGEHDDCVSALALACERYGQLYRTPLELITPSHQSTDNSVRRHAEDLRKRILRNGGCWMPCDGR